MKEADTPQFREYAAAVRANARALAAALTAKGYTMVSGGTDNHLVLWDLRPLGLTGSKMEKLCDAVAITLNKNAVHGDKSAMTPGGVRIGTPALTTRGLREAEFETVAAFLDRAAQPRARGAGAVGAEARRLRQGDGGRRRGGEAARRGGGVRARVPDADVMSEVGHHS